ncbi:hypothetical protein SDC9_56586 [bioreactor metagenome]|uniref:Uncharacterized protein n=1 Tax=bioreactor metagenome TaxID=1076179 RepID=A0A644X393_9ZZZZ
MGPDDVVHHAARPGERARVHRRPRDEPDALGRAEVQHVLAGVVGKVVAVLHRRDREAGGLGCPDLLDAHLGEPDEAYEALVDELLHHPELLLARHFRVDPMQLPQRDLLQAQAAQRHQHALAQVLRAADLGPLAGPLAGVRTLGGDGHLAVPAAVVQRFENEVFRHIRAVRVGGVDEVHAQLDRASQHRDGLVMIGRRPPHPRAGDAHRAEAEPRHRQLAGQLELSCVSNRHDPTLVGWWILSGVDIESQHLPVDGSWDRARVEVRQTRGQPTALILPGDTEVMTLNIDTVLQGLGLSPED